MTNKYLAICCAVLWLGSLSSIAVGQQADETREQPVQEAFQTRLVYPQERGEVQLSYSSRFSKGKASTVRQTPITLEYGITDRWQIEIEWNAMSRRSETGEAATRGRGDLSIGTNVSASKTVARTDPNSPNNKPVNLAAATVATPPAPLEGRLARWFELQTATFSFRYRFMENSRRVTTHQQLQHHQSFKGRFKFDAEGRYTVNALVASGKGFASSWSITGAGTGAATTNLYLKQLYVSARPIRGLEIQFGGIGIQRGESTEITTYDNNGYLVGQRLNLRRPESLFFDEISVTYAYFGDLSQPNLLRRLRRLGKSNYHQFLVSKRIGKRATVSADYTFERSEETLHQAVSVNTREFRALDTVRFENYQRLNVNPGYGFSLHGEKTLFRRLIIGGGYADIDRNHGGLNADGYLRGKRVFLNGKFNISPEVSISTFATRSFKNDFAVPNRTRLNVAFSYNLLAGLKRIGIF